MGFNFRKIAKCGFLLVVIGFFMPMACDMNGFQLANNTDSTSAVLLYGLFIFAIAGLVIGALLLMKKNVPVFVDWIPILVCIGMSIGLLSKNELELQYGAYVIGAGCAIVTIAQIISLIKKET